MKQTYRLTNYNLIDTLKKVLNEIDVVDLDNVAVVVQEVKGHKRINIEINELPMDKNTETSVFKTGDLVRFIKDN